MLYRCNLGIEVCSFIQIVKACNQKIPGDLKSMAFGRGTNPGCNIVICTDEGSRQRLLLLHPLVKVPDSSSKIKISKQATAFIAW